MGAGRPSTYDYDLCVEVCDRVMEGESIKKVLNSDDRFPSFPTWCKWKREHSELFNLYVKAIQDKGDSVDAQIDEVWQECRRGEIDASTANVLIQTLKWKAAKYYPKMFGDNKNVDLTSNGKEINTPTPIQFVEKTKNDD